MMMKAIGRILQDFRLGLSFFTCLRTGGGIRPLSAAVWTFPWIGLLIGAAAALVYQMLYAMNMSPFLAVWIAIGAQLLLTRGLHEDGFADTLDGLGGGTDPESSLAIMRDGRIGAFGAIGLIVILSIKAHALTALDTPAQVMAGWMAASAASRAVVACALRWAPFARPDGLAVYAGVPANHQLALCLTGALLILLILTGPAGLLPLIDVLLISLVLLWLAKKRLGGITGDICGALQLLSECTLLVGFTVLL